MHSTLLNNKTRWHCHENAKLNSFEISKDWFETSAGPRQTRPQFFGNTLEMELESSGSNAAPATISGQIQDEENLVSTIQRLQ